MQKTLIFIFSLFLFLSTKAQQWQKVSPAGYNYFSAASFINDKEGWVFARYGEWPNDQYDLIHTTNGSISFTSIFSIPDASKCYFLQMVDSLNGFAKIDMDWPSSDVLFWATYNGGLSWIDITDTSMFTPGNPLHNSTSYFFLDNETGFAGGTNAIFRTVDGGLSWEKMNTPTFIDSSSSNIYKPNKLFFLDNKYGWASCSMMTDQGFVLKTTDGGQNWIACKPITGDLYNIHFADTLHGGTTGGNWFYSLVILTENNFDTISYLTDHWPILADAIYYQNDKTIWISGWPAVIYKSTDGGESFVEYDTSFVSDDATDWLHDFQFFDSTGYAFAYSFILKMVDTLHTSFNPMVEESKDLLIVPNPVKNVCNVTLFSQCTTSSLFEIYSYDGLLIQRTEKYLTTGKNELSFDLSALKAGIYMLYVSNSCGKYSAKLIKQP